ncbi:MFS transporter, partial [Chloroflexota bacterium]
MIIEFSVLTHFVLYLKEALLFTTVAAGFSLAILQTGGALGKPISGYISDHLFHGSRKIVYFFMCCVAVAMSLTFAFLQPNSPLWIITLLSSILGFVAIGIGGVHLTMVGEIASKELAGTVTGISTAILQIGTVVGPPSFGYIVDTTDSYQVGWQLLAVSAAVAAILLLFVREEKGKPTDSPLE